MYFGWNSISITNIVKRFIFNLIYFFTRIVRAYTWLLVRISSLFGISLLSSIFKVSCDFESPNVDFLKFSQLWVESMRHAPRRRALTSISVLPESYYLRQIFLDKQCDSVGNELERFVSRFCGYQFLRNTTSIFASRFETKSTCIVHSLKRHICWECWQVNIVFSYSFVVHLCRNLHGNARNFPKDVALNLFLLILVQREVESFSLNIISRSDKATN